MRVLVCAVEAPLPPINGFRLMLTALVRELRREHRVRVLALRAPDQDSDAADEDLRLVARPPSRFGGAALASAIVRQRPLRADAVAASFAAPLREELASFRPDVVHVTSGRLAGLGRELARAPAVLGALDAWHVNVEARALVADGMRGRLLRAEAGRVRRFEAEEYGRFARVVVVSPQDREALLSVNPKLSISVIPNGVDTTFFAPGSEARRNSSGIAFTGVMSYAPNVLAAEFLAREVFPLVQERHPAARLALVGRAPTDRVRALHDLEGVEVTGEVPDLRPWLLRSGAYACPMLSGTGIKNKLLEAMACACACVVTPLALQGLHVEDGREVIVGTSAKELACGVLRVLEDPVCRDELGHAARRYVLSEHNWGAAARAYASVYEDVLANRGELRSAPDGGEST
jgi:polysaccharide biosynthesis protein PslH